MWKKKFGQRLRDMGTLKDLCLAAERHAHEDGHKVPAAEHLVQAAWDMPDGTARKVFARWQIEPLHWRAAVREQHHDALRLMGIEELEQATTAVPVAVLAGGAPPVPAEEEPLYGMQASGQALMQRLIEEQKKSGPDVPLLGAHVVIAAARSPAHGLLARSLQTLGLEADALVEAAEAEIRIVIAQGASS